MSNHQRILWFDREIRLKKYPNSKHISEEFEISIRQAQRDIEYLKSLGAPLSYSYSNRGYIYEHDSFILPNTFLSSTDRDFLKFLALKYSQYDHTQLNQDLAKSLSKLIEIDDAKREYLFFNLDAKQYSIYNTLITCIRNQNKVKIAFANEDTVVFHPYKFINRFQNDYIIGFNELQSKIDFIKIENIDKVTDLIQHFEVLDDIELRDYSGKVKPFKAKIRINSGFKYTNDYSICINKSEKDIIIIEFYKKEEIITFLINNDCWEEIISPKWLIASLKEKIKDILSKL